MERPSALFLLEGASASGRRQLAQALENDGFPVILGIPSKDHHRNSRSLTPESQAVFGNTSYTLREALDLCAPKGKRLMENSIQVASLQFAEAVRTMNDGGGNIVFLESSSYRLATFCYMARSSALARDEDEMFEISDEMAQRAIKATTLENTVTGVILMTDIYRGERAAQTTSTGLEEIESVNLQRTIAENCVPRGFPIRPLNPNELTLEDQLRSIYKFILKP